MNALKAESILSSIEEQAFDVHTAEMYPIDPWLQKRITIEANRVLRGEAKTVCYLEAAKVRDNLLQSGVKNASIIGPIDEEN